MTISDQPHRQSGHLRHPPAFFGALAASLGASLAVIHLMLAALFCACLAHFCAQAAKGLGKFASTSHIAGRKAANLRAIHVQLYAARHAFNVLLFQTGNSAVVARGGAGITSVDARLKLFMRHIDLRRVLGCRYHVASLCDVTAHPPSNWNAVGAALCS